MDWKDCFTLKKNYLHCKENSRGKYRLNKFITHKNEEFNVDIQTTLL